MKQLFFRRLTRVAAMLLAAVCTAAVSSCSEDDSQVGSLTPNEQAFTSLSDAAVSQFLEFAKIPRIGNTAEQRHNLDQARDYLVSWAKQHNYDVHYDEYPNVWIDVPANNDSMKGFPSVILQAHTDMICASKSGETYDYTKVVGEPYYDGDLLKGRTVNLGADDGVGVGIVLAIASSGIAHGPLRLLFTANEDWDMEGAINLDASVINSDYLICVDEEEIGKVSSGCLGSYDIDFSGTLPEQAASDLADKAVLEFKLTGLPGGHSGAMIGEHILSAATVTAKIIKDVITPAQGGVSLVNCGNYPNAISDATTLRFVVAEDKADGCISQIKSIMEAYQAEYTDVVMTYATQKIDSPASEKTAAASANETLNKFFSGVVQGVVERDETNTPTKSSNIGTIRIADNKFSSVTMIRSFSNDWLEEEKNRLFQLRADLGMTGKSDPLYTPAWSVEDGNIFRDTFICYYQENWPTVISERAKGSLECAYFVEKRPTLMALAVGPQIDGAHTIDEAVHVSTIKPILKSIVKMLQNMDKME